MYDVAVIGLGGMGSSVLAQVARRGCRAIGLEQYERSHDLGASSGRSRLIRKAYFEDPAYVPLVLRAYAAWRELEAAVGETILYTTGVLLIGSGECPVLKGARASAVTHGLDFEELSTAGVKRRFPMFAVRDGDVGVYEPDGGFIVPELACEAFVRLAESAGAQTRFGVRAQRWYPSPRGEGIRIDLDDGSELDASRVALCAGPWLASIAQDLGVPITVQRNVQHWFEPRTASFALGRCPSFLVDREDLPCRLYGFPDHGAGVKAAFHGYGEDIDPAALDRDIHDYDSEPVRRALENVLPGAAGRYLGGKACMYTLTPDHHFVIAPHPGQPRVVVAGGFSGHGFKFAPVVGEVVADLLTEGGTAYDIAFFSPERFKRA